MPERKRQRNEPAPGPLSIGAPLLATFLGVKAADRLARDGEPRPQQAIELARRLRAAGASDVEIHRRTSALLEGTPYAGVHFGAEGKPRFEVDDSTARLRRFAIPEGGSARLSDVLDHPELYRGSPRTGRVRVSKAGPGQDSNIHGNRLRLHESVFGPPVAGREQLLPAAKIDLVHEIAHDIQDRSGHAPGTSPNAPDIVRRYPNDPVMRHAAYYITAGEVEARMAHRRTDMTAAERRAVMPEPEIPWRQQIVPPRMERNRRRDMARKPRAAGGKAGAARAAAAAANAPAGDIASRLAGLKKAELQAVAREVGISAASKSKHTAAQIRERIAASVAHADYDASKLAVAAESRPWGGRQISDAETRAAGEKGAAAQRARIHAAIDKAEQARQPAAGSGPSRAASRNPGWSDAAREASAKARGASSSPAPAAATPTLPARGPEAGVSANTERPPTARRLAAEAAFKTTMGYQPPKGMSIGVMNVRVADRKAAAARADILHSPKPQGSLASRALGFAWRNQGPIALAVAASQGVAAYDAARDPNRGNKSRKDALIDAAKVAGPTAGLVAAPWIGKGASVAGGALMSAGGHIFEMGIASGRLSGILADVGTGYAFSGAGVALGGSGLALKAIGFAARAAGKLALPAAIGMAAWEGYQGYQRGGVKGAALGVADSLTFGAASYLGGKLANAHAASMATREQRIAALTRGLNVAGRVAPGTGVAALAASRLALGRAAAARFSAEQRTPMQAARAGAAALLPAPGPASGRRGFQNPKNLKAALLAQGKAAPGQGKRR